MKNKKPIKIVVDTNIVFSGILNSTSGIGKTLINPSKHFEFYSCDFLRVELFKHRKKILSHAKISEEELKELESLITHNINFINEILIPEKIIHSTELLLKDIDINDTTFVALTILLKAKLWSGDNKLVKGLRKKNFNNLISTNELYQLLHKLEQQ